MLLLLAGCGRLAFETRVDASAADTAACTWTAFSSPSALPGAIQSAVDDWSPTPSDGGLLMYMHTYRASARAQIWVASRAAITDTFPAPKEVTELANGAQQFNPTLTADALRIVYGDSSSGLFHLQEATRADLSAQFGSITPLASLNDASGNDWNPFVSADGLRIIYSSSRGPALPRIFESTRPTLAQPFAAPVEHTELTVAGSGQVDPTLSADGLEVFFASNRAGGRGGYDVYTAHRPSLDQPFGAATLVPELSSPGDDICVRLSLDGTAMYFDYNAKSLGGANADLDVATRACL